MLDFSKSVFINCPFDESFEPLFHALVLTVAGRGFTPRSARESEGQAEPRMVRIARGLMDSKYSIHDLSRFQGEGPDNLGRFNMPLELGMALGIRYLRGSDVEGLKAGREHNWLALVPDGFVHQKFVSDLAGYDAFHHDQKPATIIQRVATWLSLQPDFALPSPSARMILDAYPQFSAKLEKTKQEELTLTWPAIIRNAQITVSAMG